MLEWTGERFLPWIKDSTLAYEHLHRYAYAAALVKDKRVLDLGCGEGYGSKLLSAQASAVIGLDLDENVVRHAREKYGSPNLQFLSGSMTAVPLQEDHSFDAVVCFEAIEHIEDQDGLLSEVRRLLKPDGFLIVSTPNKAVYHDESQEENPFHVRELYFEEFQRLLAQYFNNTQFLGQRIHPGSCIWSIGSAKTNGYCEFVIDRTDSEFELIGASRRVPMYFIAIASNAANALPEPGSVLLDHSDSLLVEKNREISDRDQTIKSLREALAWREEQLQGQTEGLEFRAKQVADLEKTKAAHEEALTWRAHQVDELQTENAALKLHLGKTQGELIVASDALAGIYASRGWQWITRLRRIRDRLTGRGKPRG